MLTVAGADAGISLTYNNPSPFNDSESTSNGPLTEVDTADWELPGGGTLIADLTTTTTSTAAPPNMSVNVTPTLTYDLTGVYNYTTTSGPVPEPVSALMLGSGILALGAVRRRRKQSG